MFKRNSLDRDCPSGKPVRVALVTYAMHCGGVETFLLRLGRFLSKAGLEVHVIATCDRGEWFTKIEQEGLRAHYIEKGSNTEYFHARHIGKVLAQSGYDVIFLNHARHAQMSLGLLPNHVVVIPILHNDHEAIYDVGCANNRAWNVAVAVSPKVAVRARSRVEEDRVVHIPYGVEPALPELLLHRAGSFKPLRLIFAGRLVHEQKGVLLLPEILQQCLRRGVDATLTILGDGPDLTRLRAGIQANGIGERVHLLGILPPERMYEALSSHHILLLPSYYEGLPIILLEAMACGCVPVVSRLPGITDVVVEDGISGLLAAVGDTSDFSHKVETLATNQHLWGIQSNAARRAAGQFSVETMGRSYLRLIERALAGQYPLPRDRRWQPMLASGLMRAKDFSARLSVS